jgi:hypothetical protein
MFASVSMENGAASAGSVRSVNMGNLELSAWSAPHARMEDRRTYSVRFATIVDTVRRRRTVQSALDVSMGNAGTNALFATDACMVNVGTNAHFAMDAPTANSNTDVRFASVRKRCGTWLRRGVN